MYKIFSIAALFFLQTVAANEISVTDDLNRVVKLQSPAQRIISLAPHITENLFAAGAGDLIVGAMNHSHYPEAAKSIPVIANYAQINLEAVINLNPDLIIAWQTKTLLPMLKKIEDLGFLVYYSRPRTPSQVIDNIDNFAKITNRHPQISTTGLRQELKSIHNKFSRRKTKTVFYQIWDNPLTTLNGKHIISQILKICGAKNIFHNLKIIAPRVSVESVLAANPDIIIGARSNYTDAKFDLWRAWDNLNAAKNAAFVLVDNNVMNQPTARMILSIRNLCEQIDAHRKK